ncbi:MAG TPA: addiction module antidote protein [Anaeromyxobacter sp.]
MRRVAGSSRGRRGGARRWAEQGPRQAGSARCASDVRVTTALGNIARARGMSQLARKTGLTREGLYKALSPGGNPEFGTVMKVIRALGLELHGAPAKG